MNIETFSKNMESFEFSSKAHWQRKRVRITLKKHNTGKRLT